jgi:acyl-CoA thioesterase-1
MKSTHRNFSFYLLFILAAWLTSCSASTEKKQAEEGNQIVDSTANKTILFFGNSLTAGYGIDPEESFAGRIQTRLDSLKKEFPR